MRFQWCTLVMGTLLLVWAPFASAREKQIIFTGGVNVASFAGDADEIGNSIAAGLETEFPGTSWESESKSRIGFDAGAELVVLLGEAVGIQPGLHYAQRGGKWTFTETSGTGLSGDGTVKLDYIELPVLLRVTPLNESSIKVFFNAGPVVSFRTSSKFHIKGSDGSEDTQDFKDETESTSFGAIGGVGLDLGVGKRSSVVVETRYHLGFSNVVKDLGDLSLRHSDAEASAGFAMRFGGP